MNDDMKRMKKNALRAKNFWIGFEYADKPAIKSGRHMLLFN